MTVMPPESLPLGLRFHPTEEELVGHYLMSKISGKTRPDIGIIPEVDIYKCEPWELPDKSLIRSDDHEWFFFAQKDRKYVNGNRTNRATKCGYWKTTGRDRVIRSQASTAPVTIGMMKILVFHHGRAPNGVNTNWIIHEYRAKQHELETVEQGDYVLCRLFRKAEEKNGRRNREETDGVFFSPNQIDPSPGDTQQEGDDLKLDPPIVTKTLQAPSVSDLHEKRNFVSNNEDHGSLKVEDSHGNNRMELDLECHDVKDRESVIYDPMSYSSVTTTETKHPSIGIKADPPLVQNYASEQSEATMDYENENLVNTEICLSTVTVSSSSFKLEEAAELHPSRSALANQNQLKNDGKLIVMPLEVLPVGFRFHPTDEEIVNHYLKRKLNGQIQAVDVIPEIDVCKYEPWDLPYKSPVGLDASAWLFFSSKDKKYPTGNRSNRATNAGYWKVSGRDRVVRSKAPGSQTVIGMKKSLIFYRGRAPKGVHTHWVMHEYRPAEQEYTNGEQVSLVIYRLFRKINEKIKSANMDEMERSGSSSSPIKSSPEHEDNAIEELHAPIKQTAEEPDAPMNQVSSASHLQEQQLFSIPEQNAGVTTAKVDKADLSSLKSECSFSNNNHENVDSDREVKVRESLVSRCLSSLFTSTTRTLSSQIAIVGSPVPFGNISVPVASFGPVRFLYNQNSASVSSVTESTHTMVKNFICPLSIDPSCRGSGSCQVDDNEESHSSTSTLAAQIQDHCDVTAVSTRAASCNTQSSSGEQSTGSSHISTHLTLLRSLFSKSLSELSLEKLTEASEAAKIVSSASGMHKDLSNHLQSVIKQAHILKTNLNRQNQIISANKEPIDELDNLEQEMPKLTARLEFLKREVDRTVAFLLHSMLQSGEDDNLEELRDELEVLSRDVADKESRVQKLRREKQWHEFAVGLARDAIKKLEDNFTALAEPFRDYFVPRK